MTPLRSSGILLHPTSLPGRFGSGDFGPSAYHFVDWLAVAGQHLWQVLPFAPPGCGDSPYMSVSTLAGDPMLVSPELLLDQGLLCGHDAAGWPDATGNDRHRIDFSSSRQFRMDVLRRASRSLATGGSPDHAGLTRRFDQWRSDNAWWADDYALFMALSDSQNNMSWHDWPAALRSRAAKALSEARQTFSAEILFWQFVQWQFDMQWAGVRQYAAERKIKIVGDMPIYCALDSVDVWQNPDLFQLDKSLNPTAVAGVPPDYFSETGQLWGNPLYDWPVHQAQGYAWWVARVRRAMQHADIVRIDHFRAFAEYWAVPADAPTAIDGQWRPGPGKSLFDGLAAALGSLPIIAEDLGTITPDVIELRDAVGLPGMAVLQFAFGDDANNSYLPHNLVRHCVVYTGTHDNDTSVGWFNSASASERCAVQTYLQCDGSDIHWDLIHAASSSVAAIAIYPMQDVLGLGPESRMNTPGVADGQWTWRFDWDQVLPWHAERLRSLSSIHGRDLSVSRCARQPKQAHGLGAYN